MQAQELQAVLFTKIPLGQQQTVVQDHLGDIYELTHNELTKKINTTIRRYKNPFLGNVTFIDVRNPLQVVLFYHASNAIVLVDNQLSEMNSYLFSSLFPELNLKIVSSANKNNLWLYDDVSKRIGWLDLTQMKYQLLSTPLELPFNIWNSDANTFYWVDTYAYHQIDKYGKIKTQPHTVPEKDIVATDAKYIYYNHNGQLVAYQLHTGKRIDLKINVKSASAFFLNSQNLTIFTNQEILVFNLKEA